jgi:hypothetical protein
MKSYQSKLLKYMGTGLLGFPVWYLLLTVTFFNIPASNILDVLFSPFYYFVSFWVVLAGYGLREMHRWAWYVLVFSMSLVVYQNFVLILNYSENQHGALTFLISFIGMGLFLYWIAKEIRVPYFFPRIKWWESDLNPQFSTEAWIEFPNGKKIKGQILDFSVSGCFIKSKEDFESNTEIQLQFKLFGEDIFCNGVVVWITKGAVTHPKGIGVKFSELAKDQKRLLRFAVREARRVSAEGLSKGKLKDVFRDEGVREKNEEED